ncbi:nickel ABC transporter substrate-binding protein [Paenibacillus tarimensis]
MKFVMNRSRWFILSAIILCIVIVMTGCGENVPGQKDNGSNSAEQPGTNSANKEEFKKVTLIYTFKSGSLDPHNGSTPLRAGIVETLVRLNERLEIEPWLATEWEAKDDRTWVFTIHDGVTFQDGTAVDAAAVKASFERGIAASPTLAGALKIESMEADGQKLAIVTTEPHPSLPSELVNPSASVISVAAESKMGTEAFNLAPVGTGPFSVKKFTPNIEIELERYDQYWDGAAKVNEVSYKFNEDANVRAMALQSKEADIVYQIPAEMVDVINGDNELNVESVSSLRVHYLLFNQQKPLLQDVKFREAINLLVDRESIVNDIMLGHAAPANGPFNSRLPFGSKDEVRKLDLEGAKKLLIEAGFVEGADGKLSKEGKPLTLEVATYKGRPELPLIAQLLQSDAAKLGITMNIRTVENVDTYLRENNDWDLATYSNLSAPRGDGGYFLNSAFAPGGSLNATDTSSEKINEVLGRLNATGDLKQRVELTKEATGIVAQEVPHAYAVYPNIIVGVNKRVTDWKPGAEEYYIITNKMDVK